VERVACQGTSNVPFAIVRFGFILVVGLVCSMPVLADDSLGDSRTPNQPTTLVSTDAFADPAFAYSPASLGALSQASLKQSIFVFGGRTSSGNLWNTFLYGIGAPERQFYDNYIVGAAYQRDFFSLTKGLLLGAEIGAADRFGHYKTGCDTVVYSDNIVHSMELWGGVSLRYEGITFFDTIRFSPAFTFGLKSHWAGR
jgi:hypothetical protein